MKKRRKFDILGSVWLETMFIP